MRTNGQIDRTTQTVLFLRGKKILLEEDLAALYEVETRILVQAVKRNLNLFPEDFMFRLSAEEWTGLRMQMGISKAEGRGGPRYAPFAFTDLGVAMVSSILHNDRAAKVNVEIRRAFVWFREILSSQTDLARKLGAMERRYDARSKTVFDAIHHLMA